MLVLSRKDNESIAFPNLGISLEILRSQGRAVKIGVKAPKDVRVLRGELLEGHDMDAELASIDEAAKKRRHDVRNRMHHANLALAVVQKQLNRGDMEKAQRALSQALTALGDLDQLAAEPVGARKAIQQDKKVCRALLVEDDDNERELLAGFLELCGYHVDAVGDGIEAMDYLEKQQRPDLVLLDMNMPRMDGPATVSAIRKHPEYDDIKLFVVSGSDASDFTAAEDFSGVDCWFSKPINPAAFADNLHEELSRSPS
ncbi:MAG: response regulator [Planctomycetota bacterium]